MGRRGALLVHGRPGAIPTVGPRPRRPPGAAQAKQMVTHDLGNKYSFPYVVEDIENAGAPPDENGWNTIWTGACSQTPPGAASPAAVDFATFQGFRNYIEANSAYAPAVYSAGGGGYGSWTGIFGSGFTLRTTAEWTYTAESATVASEGWSSPDATASSSQRARTVPAGLAVLRRQWRCQPLWRRLRPVRWEPRQRHEVRVTRPGLPAPPRLPGRRADNLRATVSPR